MAETKEAMCRVRFNRGGYWWFGWRVMYIVTPSGREFRYPMLCLFGLSIGRYPRKTGRFFPAINFDPSDFGL